MKPQLNLKFILTPALLATLMYTTASQASVDDAAYCISKNGTVESMVAEFSTSGGTKHGFTKKFCTFSLDGGFIAVGLSTLAGTDPNIAASFIKTLPKIEPGSPLLIGKYSNPSMNVCKNLGGANIGFNVPSGGFANKLGQSDVCVFGDGSMVSGWSLIYIANGRTDYYKVRDAIRSEPLRLNY